MGFLIMLLSFIIGVYLIVSSIFRKKNRKSKMWHIIYMFVGIMLVILAIWLAFPK